MNHQGPPEFPIGSPLDSLMPIWWSMWYAAPSKCFPRGTGVPTDNASAKAWVLVDGPAALPQKKCFSNHIIRKAVCSLFSTDPALLLHLIKPFHPPIPLVSSRCDVAAKRRKGVSGEEMSRPVSKTTSASVGVMGPCPNKNALRASDQK